MTVKTYTHSLDPVKLEEIVYHDPDLDIADVPVNTHDLEVEIDINMEDMQPVATRVYQLEREKGETERNCIYSHETNNTATE